VVPRVDVRGSARRGPDPQCIVEADIAAGVRSIRLSELQGQNVRVLRPIGLNDAARDRLAQWVVSQIGGEYDHRHAWALVRRYLRVAPKSSIAPAPNGIAHSATRFICSSLLANAFALVAIPSADPHGSCCRQHGRPPLCDAGDFERAPVFEVVNPGQERG